MGLIKAKQASDDYQQSDTAELSKSEPLKCPRCGSTNTKFCYYNNYNKSQPRHFCKSCKRHWTKGGALRTIPVGGGRKNKRPKIHNDTTSAAGRQDYQNDGTLQFPIFSSLSTFDMNNTCLIYPTSYQSLNDDHNDIDYYYPGSFDSMEESSTVTTVNIPSISSGPWPDPNLMELHNYWNWNDQIDDHVLNGSDDVNTAWDDVFAEISNPKN
ncbi:hypothetical protein BUALT_Bualt18G0109300 [Buddleja alternifolia]|uniref:Dof zinc finger protein n=1 Tax=Buddleja alternifolia TaxID=168488 RepID=A0AAV6WAK2_9LAMI|nr:hypothetical protein BUALT_Bualt18G0109300 [Buddleja alternifolia]